jgi:hypothetical protein
VSNHWERKENYGTRKWVKVTKKERNQDLIALNSTLVRRRMEETTPKRELCLRRPDALRIIRRALLDCKIFCAAQYQHRQIGCLHATTAQTKAASTTLSAT